MGTESVSGREEIALPCRTAPLTIVKGKRAGEPPVAALQDSPALQVGSSWPIIQGPCRRLLAQQVRGICNAIISAQGDYRHEKHLKMLHIPAHKP